MESGDRLDVLAGMRSVSDRSIRPVFIWRIYSYLVHATVSVTVLPLVGPLCSTTALPGFVQSHTTGLHSVESLQAMLMTCALCSHPPPCALDIRYT